MPETQDFVYEFRNLAHELRNKVDVLDKEQKKLGEEMVSKAGQIPAEYKENIDKWSNRISELEEHLKTKNAELEAKNAILEKKNTEIENLLKTQINDYKTVMKFFEEEKIAQKRPGWGSLKKDLDKEGKSDAYKAFIKAVKCNGHYENLTPEEKSLVFYNNMPQERKALYAGDATTGGFFASTDFIEELQAYQVLISNMRGICRVQNTSGEKVQMPALATDTTATWAVEQQSFTASTDPTVGMITIPVHELRGLLQVSMQNIEDSSFNLEDFIKERLAIQFARAEGLAFVSGDGNGKPRGILSYNIKASASYPGGSAGKNNVTDAIPYVPTGQASTITADSIINVVMDLKSYYEPNATYIFTRATLNTIRLLKDSQNRYLWQPFGADKLSPTLWGRPYLEMPDMPEIGAGNYPIIVGDFKNYMIVDRVSLSMQQLNELYAAQGLIGFIARKRTGGDVLIPESFRILKVAAS